MISNYSEIHFFSPCHKKPYIINNESWETNANFLSRLRR
jgi:hypothetical protein